MNNLRIHCTDPRLEPWLEELKRPHQLILVSSLDQAELVFASDSNNDGETPRLKCGEFGCFFVSVVEEMSPEALWSSKVLHRDFSLLELKQEPQALKLNLVAIFSEAKRKLQFQKEKNHLIKSNQNLQTLVETEKSKREHLEEGRQSESLALKKASASLRKRIFFLKSLNEAVEMNEVIMMIQEEARKTKGLGGFILVLNKEQFSRILYTSGRQVIEKRASFERPSEINEWRQRLADDLNRPIGPLLHLEGSKSRISIFFEHQLSGPALKEMMFEWRLRMVGLELVIDRFQLAQDLAEAALFWEKTFDGLDEPIGIFDGENGVIRANQLFTKELIAQLKEPVIRDGSKIFHVESYDIHMDSPMAKGSKVIHLSDQSSSFQLKQHMIQTEKIAALGQLAGHIAHELNNPLTGIRSLCQILLRDKNFSQEVLEDLSEVESATSRCQNIIRNLLEYSKPHSEDLRVSTDVNEVVANTLPLLKSLMGRYRSEIFLSDQPLFALVDPHMLQQVVFNLVANACQAMGQMGTITVKTMAEMHMVKIRVQDTGPGVPHEIQQEIFEPFFTTKPVGEGTGLGLSLSLNVIRGFGGDLQLDKNYSEGAAFEIVLPMERR